MSKVHGIASGSGQRWTTFCGRVGWTAKHGANEYDTASGQRFEAVVGDGRRVTCEQCRRFIAKAHVRLGNPVTIRYL